MSRTPPTRTASVSVVLSGLLRKLQPDARPSLEEVRGIWERLAGKEAAEHSWPVRLARGRMVVEVENSGWMHALGMEKAFLLEGLIELMGAGMVRQLSFRIGEGKDA